MDKKLTAKQRAFIAEYLVDLNATQAAIRAGYSERTANEQACRMLVSTDVQAAIRQAQQGREARTMITQDRVLEQYARLGFFDIRKLFDERGNIKPVSEWDDDVAAAVSGIESIEIPLTGGIIRKVKLTDRRAALSDIGKHLGMFKEKHEHTGKDGGPICVENTASPAVQELIDRLASWRPGS